MFPSQGGIEILSNTQSIRHLSFDHRRWTISTDGSASLRSSQRGSIVRQVLDASPKIRHLVLAICDLPDCSSAYANLQSLHLMLEHSMYKDRDPFDVNRFAQLAPGLRRPETSVANLMLDQKLVHFILHIITKFHQLVHLVINKRSQYRSRPLQQDRVLQMFVATCEERGYDGRLIDLRLGVYDRIDVWL